MDGDERELATARSTLTAPAHYCFQVNSMSQRVRFTLVWNDPRGFSSSSVALVNDLDLIVKQTVGANRRAWLGNEYLYESGWFCFLFLSSKILIFSFFFSQLIE